MRNTCVVPQCQNCSPATAEQSRNSFWFTKLSNARLNPNLENDQKSRNLDDFFISPQSGFFGFEASFDLSTNRFAAPVYQELDCRKMVSTNKT